MKYDDLEKTMDLFDINDIPSPIETIEMEGIAKNKLTEDTINFNAENISEEPKEEAPAEQNKKKKEKKSLKEKWSNMPKKKKIILLVSIIIILIILIVVILLLVLKKDEKDPTPTKKPEEAPSKIVEQDNYIYKDGTLTFLDSAKNEIGTYECTNKDEKLCFVSDYNTEDTFDTSKNIYTTNSVIPTRSTIYLNNYVFIFDNASESVNKITLYNIKEAKNEGVYSLVKGFKDSNYVIVKNSDTNKYGVLELTETEVKERLAFAYDYLGALNKDSKFVAKTNNKYFIYSKDGKLESKAIPYEIKSYTDKYIVADNNGYYLYDYKGNLIFDESYDYISLLDNYAALIKNRRLYIKDYKNNKYNEEGIKLKNDDYNVTNVYTSDKTLTETKKSFALDITENTLNITIYNKDQEDTETINLNEGALSSKYAYLNYFDGHLYFYSDEDKNELLGSYSCSNKNMNKDSLTNCLVATDSNYTNSSDNTNLGWIPIFNKRYVFILDSLDSKIPTIVLYDLKNSKTLSKYTSVDTSSYTKENKITFKDTNAIYVMASNKSNKYGMIKIENEVKSAIPFNYDAISKLKDYYLVKENSGTYMLMSKDGDALTKKYGYPIVDYRNSYLTVQDSDYYYIYNFNSEDKLNESKFKDIKLYDDYYVVIDINTKLNIHKYDDASFSLSTPIEVDEASYKTDYEVGKSSSGFIIKIKSKNKTYNTDTNGVLPGDKLPSAIDPDTTE